MYTYNYSYGYSLGYSGGYNPYINYTWQMLPNAKVKNSGTSGVDLQLYSGNPLDFQGSQYIDISSSNIVTQQNQSISFRCKSDVTTSAVILGWQQNSTYLYTENNMYKVRILGTIFELYPQSANGNYCVFTYNFQDKSFMFYVDGIKVYTSANNAADFSNYIINYVGCGQLSSTTSRYFYDGQLDYVIITNSILTQEQITQSVEQPNQFFKDMSTNSNTLFCTDFRGNAGYIADSKNYSVGSELVTNGSFDSSLGYTTTGESSIANGVANIYSSAGAFSAVNTVDKFSNLDYYMVTIEVSRWASGQLFISQSGSTSKGLVPIGVGTFSIVYKSTYNTETNFTLGRNLGVTDMDITNISIKKLSGVYPIINYSATQRSNFTQESKGLQDLTRSFDSNGFFVDNVSYLNCNGKGKATIIEPSRTSNITIKTNPTTLSGNILSGGVVKTTAGLTSGVDNYIVLSNQVISSNIDIGVGYTGKISVYKEDKLS